MSLISRLYGYVALASLMIAVVACGRNGPLPPWPAFDLAHGTALALPPPADLGIEGPDFTTAPPDMTLPPVRLWQWVNPAVTANTLHAVGGTAGNDLWLVGDVGTILHWDGQLASVAHATGPHDSFVSVAAVAPNDVWIAGQTSGGSILHWDGNRWSSDYSISGQTIHALTAGPGAVYAAVDVGGVGQLWQTFPVGGWYNDYDNLFNTTSILRDIAAFANPSINGRDDLIVVGDKGVVMWRNGWQWTKGTPSMSGDASDPFTSDKDYFGVWGATASDVWAAFTSGTQLGFSHFDGKAWTVQETLTLTCTGRPSSPLPLVDRGKRLIGLDKSHILAVVSAPSCSPFLWNGTTWARVTANDVPAQASLTVAGGQWYAVTGLGQLRASSDGSSWTSLPEESRRDNLVSVTVSDDGVWSMPGWRTQTPLRWGDAGWEVKVTPKLASGNVGVGDLWALNDHDVWLAGTYNSQGAVLHWNGSSWSEPTTFANTDRLTSIWADSDEDVWVAGGGDPNDGWGDDSCRVLHFDGKSWTDVPVPSHPWGVVVPALFGLGPDAVWITTHIWDTTHRATWKWDGSAITQQAWTIESDTQSIGRPWASAADDVWVPGQPVLHWDGQAWSAIATPAIDLPINAIYGTARDDVWAAGAGPFGGAIWHFENGGFVVAFNTESPLKGISGSAHQLPYVVGENGATLRLVTQPR
jgi:hypothetical protein